MAALNKQVDVTSVNYLTNFNYTINASFNGISGDINDALITDFIPDSITYTLPPIISPLVGITQSAVSGGTLLTFELGTIVDTGVAIVINFACRFKVGSSNNGDTFVNHVNSYANGELVASSDAPMVTLNIKPNWQLAKSMIAPSNNQPSPGGTVYYLVSLRNLGDYGASLTNVVITDTFGTGITPDPLFVPIGKDWSGLDSSANGDGTVSGDTVTFNIPSYSGTFYAMIIKASIDNNVAIGTSVINYVAATANQITDLTTSLTSIVSKSNYDMSIGKYGPTHSKAGNKISYEIYGNNVGNEDLTNVDIIDSIPAEVNITQVFVGNYGITSIGYYPLEDFTLYYSTDNQVTYNLIGTYPYGYNNYWDYVDLTALTSLKITHLKWNFPIVPVGFTQYNAPRLNGIVDPNTIATTTKNIATIYWTVDEVLQAREITVNTLLDGSANIIAEKQNEPSSNVVPTQILKYSLNIYGNKSQIDNPVFIDLLPIEVDYVGNYTAAFYDYYQANAYFDLNTPNTPIPNPTVTITPDFEGSGRTQVKFEFDGFSILQRNALNLRFEVQVKIGATGTISNNAIMGNKGKTLVSSNTPISDTDDMDNDGITTENLAQTGTVNNVINFVTSIATDKKVKGSLDTEFTEEPLVGKTFEGGTALYKLTVKNTGNQDIETIEIVDILPYIGDTGVILTNQTRNSAFAVSLGSSITATLTPSDPLLPPPSIVIEYSTSANPPRFGENGEPIGDASATWTIVPPTPITLAKSFRITTIDTIIQPNQSLIINIDCVVPLGTTPSMVAWNSYALRGSYYNQQGTLAYLLPVEPEKVGIAINVTAPEKVKLGDFVWIDTNKNGIWDEGELGLNGVTVELYDPTNLTTPITTTVTSDNISGNPGYYLFNNLPAGQYVVKFVAPEQYRLTKQVPSGGSQPNPSTGLTPTIVTVVTAGSQDLTIDAGLYPILKPGSIGDRVWINEELDGVQRPTDIGVPGVNVMLYNCDGSFTNRTATTDEQGYYLIDNVEPGKYFVVFRNIIPNFQFVTANNYVDAFGRTPNCFTLGENQNLTTIDAPIAQIPCPTCPKGEDGKDGADGKDGVDGKDGADGKDGNDGKDGADGKDGMNGNDGNDGKDGKDGKDGSDGKDGKDGNDGKDGSNGKDGADGKDGKDGNDGADGKDGMNGKDGADGKDGTNGKDGVCNCSNNSCCVGYVCCKNLFTC